MKKLLAVMIIFLALVLYAYAEDTSRTASMNLAFNIVSASDDVSKGDNFVSSQGNDIVVALVSSSETFSTNNHSYGASQYLLQMNQSLETNRFLLVITNGTNQTIRENLNSLGDRAVLGKTFGPFNEPVVSQFPLFIRLQYEDVNILDRLRILRNARLVIRNEGKEDGLTKISFDLV